MIGNVSIDFSLSNVWRSWYRFRRGKRRTATLDRFQYFLERNLYELWRDLNDGAYRHGPYSHFVVNDTKRRTISVSSFRDKVVHRLLYDYLVEQYDKTFHFDVWSCRENKGLVGAIERTQKFLSAFPHSFVWRCDIKKFFDHVDHAILLKILKRKIKDPHALAVLKNIIASYPEERERESKCPRRGVPIGNLTSQIFANIYLNEFDRFVTHELKPLRYLRYGDDFIFLATNYEELLAQQYRAKAFLEEELWLAIQRKNDILVKARHGIHFLGVELFPGGRRLNARAVKRAVQRMRYANLGSYHGLIFQHQNGKICRIYEWQILSFLEAVI